MRVSDWTLLQPEIYTTYAIEPQALAFSPRGTLLVAGGGPHVSMWSVESGSNVWQTVGNSYAIHSVAFSSCGDLVAVGGGESIVWPPLDAAIRILSAQDGRLVRTLEGHNGRVSAVQFSNDGLDQFNSVAGNSRSHVGC